MIVKNVQLLNVINCLIIHTIVGLAADGQITTKYGVFHSIEE